MLKVSIIIPVYDVSAYIRRCLNSVMCQKFTNIECIIVDDATPDDSILQCEQIIGSYLGPIKFLILHHLQNEGLSVSRNTGIKAATGDYVFFLDSDDELSCDCIEKMIEPIKHDPTIEMVLGNVDFYSDGYPLPPSLRKRKRLCEDNITNNENVRNFFFGNNGFYGNAWNRLVNRSFINKNQLLFREKVLWEDGLWTFYVMKYLKHLYIIPDITYFHYKRPNSIMTGTDKETAWHFYGITYEEISSNFTKNDVGREAAYYLVEFCNCYISNADNPAFVRSALRFKRALSGDSNTLGVFFLSMTILLARIPMGMFIFRLLSRLKKSLDTVCG